MAESTRKPVEQPSLPDKVVVLHEALSAARIPHAFGGALALAYYAEPRTTIDIDLNLFLPPDQWEQAIAVLTPLGVATDAVNPAALIRDGQCRLRWGRSPVDLFFAYDPIHDEMRERGRRLPFAGEALPFLAPEHLAVCKAMFNRPKDWLDIEQMIVASDDLDLDAVVGWLTRMVGNDDFRVARIEALRPG